MTFANTGRSFPVSVPGKATQDYLDKVMTRITLAGALFLAFIALLQYWIPALTNTGGAGGFTSCRRNVAADRRRPLPSTPCRQSKRSF